MSYKELDKDKPTFVTVEDCDVCEEAKKEFEEAIKNGQIAHLHCDPHDKNPDRFKLCEVIFLRKDFDGFPIMFNEKGEKVL